MSSLSTVIDQKISLKLATFQWARAFTPTVIVPHQELENGLLGVQSLDLGTELTGLSYNQIGLEPVSRHHQLLPP